MGIPKVLFDLCKNLGIKVRYGKPYHPQTQGSVERMNQRLKKSPRNCLLDINYVNLLKLLLLK